MSSSSFPGRSHSQRQQQQDTTIITCVSCHTQLQVPINVQLVKCGSCETVMKLKPQVKTRCSGCRVLLYHPEDAPAVQCAQCGQITQTKAQANCRLCGSANSFPATSTSFRCYICHQVTQLPPKFNESVLNKARDEGIDIHVVMKVLHSLVEKKEEEYELDDIIDLMKQEATKQQQEELAVINKQTLVDWVQQLEESNNAKSTVKAFNALVTEVFTNQRSLVASFSNQSASTVEDTVANSDELELNLADVNTSDIGDIELVDLSGGANGTSGVSSSSSSSSSTTSSSSSSKEKRSFFSFGRSSSSASFDALDGDDDPEGDSDDTQLLSNSSSSSSSSSNSGGGGGSGGRSLSLFGIKRTKSTRSQDGNGREQRSLSIAKYLQPDVDYKVVKTQLQNSVDVTGGSDSSSALDTHLVNVFYSLIANGTKSMQQNLRKAIEELLENPRTEVLDVNDVRMFIVLLENPFLATTEYQDVLAKVAQMIACLSKQYQDLLILSWSKYPRQGFERLVTILHQAILHRIQSQGYGYDGYEGMHRDYAVIAATRVLGLLYYSNELGHQKTLYANFYNQRVNDFLNVEVDYAMYLRQSPEFTFCRYPCILNLATKNRILKTDAEWQMKKLASDTVAAGLMRGVMSSPYLLLRVRRNHIIEDALHQLSGRSHELKKQLKVQFAGEEGIDAGGLQKEFFQLIVREIFNPQYGMFTYDEETRLFNFAVGSLESVSEYALVGIIIGLAIYNGVILDLHFPFVIYKKLMGYPPTLRDLYQVNPILARSFQQLLDFEGDVEETFSTTFAIEYEVYGEKRTHELFEGGQDVAVTNDNRLQYVQGYLDWYFNISISKQFEAFATAFNLVCGGKAMQLLRPEELELLICGSPVIDMDFLQSVTEYKRYTANNKVIRWLWDLLQRMPPDQQRKFLFFTTGSDRVPYKGIGDMKLLITRSGGHSDQLPMSATCFNELLLPEYNSAAVLEERLLLAIENTEGFGRK